MTNTNPPAAAAGSGKLFQFPPPEYFDFGKPEKWSDWKKRFERFRTATRLTKEDGDVQVATLVYSMGPDAENIFESFNLSNDNSKKYDVVLKKFNEHFVPKVNTIRERAVFNKLVQ